MNKIEVRRFVALGFTSLMLTTSAGWAHDDSGVVRFQATLQTTSWVFPSSPPGRCAAPAVPLQEVAGSGDTNLLGVVFDQQSHCIGNAGAFDGGRFTLTNPNRKTIEGRYFGRLVTTFNSKPGSPPTVPPSGSWLIEGNVCIVSVAGRPVSDCSHPPTNYSPARGTADLNPENGAPATIFIDQFIRFK